MLAATRHLVHCLLPMLAEVAAITMQTLAEVAEAEH